MGITLITQLTSIRKFTANTLSSSTNWTVPTELVSSSVDVNQCLNCLRVDYWTNRTKNLTAVLNDHIRNPIVIDVQLNRSIQYEFQGIQDMPNKDIGGWKGRMGDQQTFCCQIKTKQLIHLSKSIPRRW